MTVRELIEALQALPEAAQDAEVQMEGCDCDGTARGLDWPYWGDPKEVLITR